MSRWTLQAVEKAAPDAASMSAARKLAKPGPWSETGSTDTLVWGKCQGSGRTPYQVSIDLDGPAYRCSCPSRKFPCKHALALLLLYVAGDGSVSQLEAPADFAASWAEQRADRAASAAAPKKAPDPEARARRQAERFALMSAGIDDFALWLQDLVRSGIAGAGRQPWSWWDQAAARLVDAQLPGLAERVRDMSAEVSRRDDWADHLLIEIGRWWTATRAWKAWDELDEATRGDLRTVLGWTVPTAEVRAADAIGDRWVVLGAHRSDDGRLQQQRTWLYGQHTGELVQILDFAGRDRPLPVAQLVGSVLEVTLARYPGSVPRRALFAEEPVPVGRAESLSVLPPVAGLAEALDTLARIWARNPWAGRAPVVITAAVLPPPSAPSKGANGSGVPYVLDPTGVSLPLTDEEDPGRWQLLARTGGRPTTIFGEVQGQTFRPLSIDTDAGPVGL